MVDSRKLHDIRARASQIVKNALGTPAGEALLLDLEDRYVDLDLFDHDPIHMAYNVAKRDLVVLLRRQLNEEVPDV